MDLKKLWNSLDASDFDGGNGAADRLQEIRQHSSHPMARLRLRLKQKFWWSVGITVFFILVAAFLLLFMPETAVHYQVPLWIIAVTLVVANWSSFPLLRAYRELSGTPDVTNHILACLQDHRDTGKMIYRMESRVAYAIAIPSPAAGALISLMSDGTSFAEIWAGNEIWVVLIIGVLTAPFVIWLTNWMNKVAFGKELGQIEGLITDLEALEEDLDQLGEEVVRETDGIVKDLEAWDPAGDILSELGGGPDEGPSKEE